MKTPTPPLWLLPLTLPLLVVPYFLIEWYDQLLAGLGPVFFLLLAVSVAAALVAGHFHRFWLASLRLTVALMTLSILLIFIGTLAQVEVGVWEAVERYFRSMVVWVPVDVFRPLFFPGTSKPWQGEFLFPGGFLLLGLLIQNLVAAHAERYKVKPRGGRLALGVGLLAVSVVMFVLTVAVPRLANAIQQDVLLMLGIWAVPMALSAVSVHLLFGGRKAGVVLVHAGLVLLLVGEFVTGLAANEGQMQIAERGGSNYIFDTRESELALVASLPDGRERHVVVPQWMLERAERTGEPIEHPDLPAAIRVEGFLVNSNLRDHGLVPGDPTRVQWEAVEAETNSGTSGASQVDIPSAVVSLPVEGGGWRQVLVSCYEPVRPEAFVVDGVTWRVGLRFKRTYLPYTIQLHDFRNETFTGSTVARNFSSDLRVIEPDGSAREAFIKMNQPLRYDGKAFFQSSFFQSPLNRNTGTVLQVAQNPGSWLPYLSCVVVTVGLCMQFGGSLMRYGRRTAAKGIG